MCGIAGIWRKKGSVTASEIGLMSKLISHRGPDDVGHVLVDSDCRLPLFHFTEMQESLTGYDLALANRRLSIIDLSPGGHQPMTYQGCTLVYNGEIYNYHELRAELSLLGHIFSSSSDTEVLLHTYLEWGTDCLSRLNGMFAFAIWDDRKQTLFCARDRLGVKPFYYFLSNEEFIFASEIKSILAVLKYKPEVNEKIAFDFLVWGLLDHTSETFFDGILRLSPGSYVLAYQGSTQFKRYWDLPESEQKSKSPEENAEEFRHLFNEAVQLQMRSDVTIGCCLSGGMDSTALVCTAAPLSSHPIKTFTARYLEKSIDEWPYVLAVASKVEIETFSVLVQPADFWAALPDVVRSQEEPFGGPSIYAQWKLMQTIRSNGVKVVLDGQGADELLCGYAKYFYYSLWEMWTRRDLRRIIGALLLALENGGVHLLDFQNALRYLPKSLQRIIGRSSQAGFDQEYLCQSTSPTRGMVMLQQTLDIQTYSLPVLLRYEDKNSMAHSVESRVPFLDHRLVEFALRLPMEHKIRGAQAKQVMRNALADIMPSQIMRRR